ncbi:D-alanyl-D-alanine carboxypeptidase [candidate division WWE3 bacterium]|jgi:D-alanyl-D-alanine carboxypeptidase (penicillin-binding protein 5/6)|uniref:D-alanyl-D-alanine carboxypeptidase n=1 Tax=candidate division WWE3 bacterium TaxID=2053526 RepID=A0A3A4ZBA7_UNCKA|nr:MAG: D-alanyl-D-alanine carboxypeptidase [candidate division WWE3 bacterium]
MEFTVGQKLQLSLVKALINAIWALESVTGVRINIPVYPALYGIYLGVFNTFLIFLLASFSTDYFAWLGQGIVSGLYPQSGQGNYFQGNNILGAAIINRDIPIMVNDIRFPQITADAVLIVDRNNKKTLFEQNSSTRLASASTTKLMTALIAMEIYDLEDLVTISEECASIDSTRAGLPAGTEYRVRDLLNAMLVSSAGDAACALSESKVNTDEFLYKMNQKAYQLKMDSTFFTNAIGLDGYNRAHFSNASDLYKLTVAAMANKTISGIVKTKEYSIKSTDESYIGSLTTTNQLLWEIPQTVGVKTGTTVEAGQVLIYEYRDEQKDVVIIVMGSEDRFSDTRSLLNWAFASYSWDIK